MLRLMRIISCFTIWSNLLSNADYPRYKSHCKAGGEVCARPTKPERLMPDSLLAYKRGNVSTLNHRSQFFSQST